MDRGTASGAGDLRLYGVLVLCGVVLLACSVLVGITGLTDTYKHDVTAVGEQETEIPVDGSVLTSEDLTLSERALLLEAAASDSAVWTSDPVGLRFEYPVSTDSEQYTVELDESRYVLETSTVERPVMIVATGLRVSLLIAGAFLLLSGGVRVFRSAFTPEEMASEPLGSLFGTWLPAWAVMILAPSTVLCLLYPIIFESVFSIPFNLFITPLLLGMGLCTVGSVLTLRIVSLEDTFVLASAVNIPVLWAVLVSFAVAPTTGATQATVTLLVGVAGLSVLVGLVLGWYGLHCLEMRKKYPHREPYWQI